MQKSKTALILLLALVIIGSAFYIHAVRPTSNPTSLNGNLIELNPIFNSVNTTLPSANWSTPSTTTEQTIYGNLSGLEESGMITSKEPSITAFEDPNDLTSLGYKKDISLDASGPGSNVWGYKKTENGKSQIVMFSYATQGTSNPNEPIQFNCPCKVSLKVFVSDPFDEK
jgi:hypothetical protein